MKSKGFVDVGFPAKGRTLPVDHGYLLFTALCHLLPRLREEPNWGVHPVLGRALGPTHLELFQHSLVQLRIPTTDVGHVTELGSQSLRVGRHLLKLGPPTVYPLQPARNLQSRCVTVHGHEQPAQFAEGLRHELSSLPGSAITASIEIDVGERRYVRTRSHAVPGFEVTLSNLELKTSIEVQAHGVGGRRYLGLGLFMPKRAR